MTRIVFLGGVGEIGRNMTVIEHDGRLLIVDVGLMFPTEEMLGVDLVLPDYEYVRDRADDIEGILITHGHEDHLGGLPFFMREFTPPIYGARLTLGLLRNKLEEHRLLDVADLNEVQAPGSLQLGPFDLEFFNMAHSIPDALSTLIKTPSASILHTGDFKVEGGSVAGLGASMQPLVDAAQGVDLLLSDSTNADHPGFTQPESIVTEELERVIAKAGGRVIVACFASNIFRIQQVVQAAEKAGRMVSFLGRSMISNARVAKELGYLDYDEDLVVPIGETGGYPPERLVIISTGSQGEPLSSLSLMAAKDHKHIDLNDTDTVVVSATPIPGNESAVRRVVDGLFRIGAEVIQPPAHPVHVSGHASAGDLSALVTAVKPKWFVPVHGEYRHLHIHAGLAMAAGVPKERTIVVEDGDVLEIEAGLVKRGKRVHAGYILVDGLGIGDVSDVVLRDRRLLADDGVIVCVVTIDSQTGELLAGPDIISRGFVYEDGESEFIEKARAEIRDSLADLVEDGITDWAVIRKNVRRALGKFVWSETRRRPMILPIVMEV